jgi:uncharacterized repeat protein (TIGR01451 family)
MRPLNPFRDSDPDLWRLLLISTLLIGLSPALALDASTQLVSHAFDSTATTANNLSQSPWLSTDGKWMVFASVASNVVSGLTDSNGKADVFLVERDTGAKTLVSRSSSSADVAANGKSVPRAISENGRWVLFTSDASNLVSATSDSNGVDDVFLFDRLTGTSRLVSRANDSASQSANNLSVATGLSADGRWVLFSSGASNVGTGVTDANLGYDLFLFDRESLTTTLISRSFSSPLTTANLSMLPGGFLSANGRWVLFNTSATNLVGPSTMDNNGTFDVFLFDRLSGENILVSRSPSFPTVAAAGGPYGANSVSEDGRWVLFGGVTSGVLHSVNDFNNLPDVFLFDRLNGTSSLISRRLGSSATTANGRSHPRGITPDGRWVLFESEANDVVQDVFDANAGMDAFVFDRLTSQTILVSRKHGTTTETPNRGSNPIAISASGQRILFVSNATNVMTGMNDSNIASDVFLFDKSLGSTVLLSGALGSTTQTGNASTFASAMIGDGRWVPMNSAATNLVSGVMDLNGVEDLFVVELLREQTVSTIASHTPNPSQTDMPVEVVVALTGVTSQADDGLVTVTVATGESCLDSDGPISGSGTTVLFSCAIIFESAGARDLTATFSGSTTHADSVAEAESHLVVAVAEISIDDVIEVEGANGNHEFQFTISRSHTHSDISVRIDTDSVTADAEEDFVAIENQTVVFAAGGSATANVVVNVIGDLVQEPDQTFIVTLSNPGNAVISDGSGTGTITNDDTMSLTPSSLADAQAGALYDQNFVAANGLPAYGFAITNGTLPAGLSLSNEGVLSGTPTASGSFGFAITATDGTGIGDGGPFTATNDYMLNVIPGADLQITKDNGRSGLLDGETTVYAIVVANAGPNAVVGATITDELPSTLVNGSWMCVPALSTAACPLPAAGNGLLSAKIDLGVDQYLRFDVMAVVDGSEGAFVSNVVTIATPAGVTALDTSNDSAIDQDPIVPIGLFVDGFEAVPTKVLTVRTAARASTQ